MNVLSPRVVTIHEQALRSYDSRTGSPSAGLWGSTISDRVNGPSTHTPSPAQAPSCVVSPPPLACAELFAGLWGDTGRWRRSAGWRWGAAVDWAQL